MKKKNILIICSIAILILFGWGMWYMMQNRSENYSGVAIQEFSGTIVDWFTEGSGNYIVEVIGLEVNGENIIFTVIDSTEFANHSNIELDKDQAIGSSAYIVCESYTNSDYHPILSVDIDYVEEE